MSLEIIVIISVIVIIGGAFLFFSLAKRAVRLAIRLMLFLALVLVVVVGGLLLYRYATDNSKPSPQQDRPANTRRGNSR
jgi:uncharacterized protein YxeA